MRTTTLGRKRPEAGVIGLGMRGHGALPAAEGGRY